MGMWGKMSGKTMHPLGGMSVYVMQWCWLQPNYVRGTALLWGVSWIAWGFFFHCSCWCDVVFTLPQECCG